MTLMPFGRKTSFEKNGKSILTVAFAPCRLPASRFSLIRWFICSGPAVRHIPKQWTFCWREKVHMTNLLWRVGNYYVLSKIEGIVSDRIDSVICMLFCLKTMHIGSG